MASKGNLYNRLVYAVISQELRQAYIGLTCNLSSRLAEHRKGRQKATKELVQAEDLQIIQLTGWVNKDEAIRLEAYYIEHYRNIGFVVMNKAKAGALGTPNKVLTKEKVYQIASEYDTYLSFWKARESVRQTAYKDGYLQELKADLFPTARKPPGFWTKEKVLAWVKSCKSYKDFTSNKGLYLAAQKLNLLEDIKGSFNG
jgi:predicted GIY-YIG superfamily endonuclease